MTLDIGSPYLPRGHVACDGSTFEISDAMLNAVAAITKESFDRMIEEVPWPDPEPTTDELSDRAQDYIDKLKGGTE